MILFDYDPATGRILCKRMYPGSSEKTVQELMSVYPDALFYPDGFEGDDVTHYVLAGEAVQREVQLVTLVGMKLRGVRMGASVIIEGESYNVTDTNDIELEFSYPGKYEVKVIDWPYIDWSVEVEN